MEENNPKNFNFFLKGSNGKAVMLIHGITGTPSEMRYLGRKLNKAGYSVFCNALPRHCSSLGELKKVTWQEIEAGCISDLDSLKKDFPEVYIGGLSMGALLAVHLAHKNPDKVKGVIALAPTLFYDGWALHKGKVLMNLVWHVPFIRRSINIREGWPYGLKDEYIRKHIERFYRGAKSEEFDEKELLFGSPFFPLACLYEHQQFIKVVKKELASVKTPLLIIHAKEDDMVSLKNARYLYDHIGSEKKDLIILNDSYHMITIDQEKDKVAESSVKFLESLN